MLVTTTVAGAATVKIRTSDVVSIQMTTEGSDYVVDPEVVKWVKFQNLVEEWKNKRGVSSSLTEAAMQPSYQRIIGMGEQVVPMLLKQLSLEGNDPDQWFWALQMITDSDPVRPEDKGNFRKMSKAWIEWGEQQGYAW